MLSADASGSSRSSRGRTGICVLVADDDTGVRSLSAASLRQAWRLLRARGQRRADAVRVTLGVGVQVAVLDLNMRRDGLQAALKLAALQPSMRIALHSSDRGTLRERAGGSRLPAHVSPLAPKLDLSCLQCGYGIVSRAPPARCPMCQAVAVWREQGRLGRDAAAYEPFSA